MFIGWVYIWWWLLCGNELVSIEPGEELNWPEK